MSKVEEKSEVVEASASDTTPESARGPLVKATAIAHGLIGSRVVAPREVVEAPECDVVEAMVRGVAEPDGVPLSGRGRAYLASRCREPYTPPVPPVIDLVPIVKMKARQDNAMFGSFVLSKGGVVDVPEDEAAWHVIRSDRERSLDLAPGAAFSPRGMRFLEKLRNESERVYATY
ncbi:hypothetical protein [Paludisphaera mucosa]|uniref:Uncharacterized protein n=1 Tax=Paludisphaera mucosa TaxID=3030827 RepID=A0ABT6FGJ1_9BACT|nr:hypothetical protein [Paludisphaera mucosa]MDG3006619.1 hypothetical protein [Paludisphaera mucosa]